MGTEGAARRWAVSAASDGGAGELLGEPSRSRPQPVAPALRSCPLPPAESFRIQYLQFLAYTKTPQYKAGLQQLLDQEKVRAPDSVPEGPPTCLGTAAARTRGSLATLGAWGCPPTLSPAAFPRAGSIRLWRSKSRRPVPPSDGGLGEPGGPHVAVSACGEVWLPSSWGAVLVVSDVG